MDGNTSEGWFDINVTQCIGGLLSPFESFLVEVNFSDSAQTPVPYNATNIITINATDILGNSTQEADSRTIEITSAAQPPSLILNVSVIKQASQINYSQNETITFFINITNTGTQNITNLSIIDIFNNLSLSFAGATPSPNSTAGDTINWFVNLELTPDTSYFLTVNFSSLTNVTEGLNEIEVYAYNIFGNDTYAYDNETVVILGGPGPASDISVIKDLVSGGPFTVGSNMEFMINLTNLGSQNLTNRASTTYQYLGRSISHTMARTPHRQSTTQ